MTGQKNRIWICALAAAFFLQGCAYIAPEVTVIGREGESPLLTEEAYVPAYEENSPEEEARKRREEAARQAEETYANAGAEEEKDPNRRTMDETMNLRDAPGMDSVIIALIPRGATVTLTGEEEDGWWPVDYADFSGYVKAGFFVEDRKEEKEQEESFEEEEEREVKEGRILDDEDASGGPGEEDGQESVPALIPGETMEEPVTELPPEVMQEPEPD